MAGGDVAQRERKTKGKKKKKGRRLGVRIDMTPLVDVAFLLLTFFMLTTSMSRPQTMEINLPPDKDVKVDVAEFNLLTLRINKEGAIYWSAGIGAPKLLPAGTLRTFLKEQATNPKIVALIKIEKPTIAPCLPKITAMSTMGVWCKKMTISFCTIPIFMS